MLNPTPQEMWLHEVELRQFGELSLATEGALLRIDDPIVRIDSRAVSKGDIFVALQGEKTDGHLFLESAFQNGAALAIVNKAFIDAHPETRSLGTLLMTHNSLTTLQELAMHLRKKADIPLIAIGGNSGKTTTKEMIAALFNAHMPTLSTAGNLNNHIGVPMTLFGLRPTHEIAIIEMGMNHDGEMTQLCTIAEPTHGLITNIGKAHIEFFGSIDNVAKAEAELFDYLAEHDGTGIVVMNDPLVREKSRVLKRKQQIGIINYPGLPLPSEEALDLRGEILGQNHIGAVHLRISGALETFDVTLSLSGKHNALNALNAISCALTFGIPIPLIQEVLSRFTLPESLKRMIVTTEVGMTVINDTYNANPESMRAGIDALCDMAITGKRIVVLGDMLELGDLSKQEHQSLGQYMSERNISVLLTYGTHAKSIHDSAVGKAKHHFTSKADIARWLCDSARAGDGVLFKGSRGMKMEEVLALWRSERQKTRDMNSLETNH